MNTLYYSLHQVLKLHNDDNHADGFAEIEVLSKLIEVRRKLVMEKNGDGDTALHLVCGYNYLCTWFQS